MTAYFWTTIALFPLGILAITIILHMLRKWGRGRITTILEMALEYDPQTIIECWSIAYNNVDRSVTLAMEEVIHNNLEIALPSMEDCPKLHKPLLYSIYKNWNLEKKNLLIAVSLEYFSKFGTKKEYNSLKLATKSFKHAFVGSNTNARVNHDRDEIVKRWRSRIENDRMSIMSDVSQLLRPTEHGNHDLLKPVLRNEKETENLLHPSIWPGEHSDVMETKVDEQNSQDK